jgi:hypothetical protein
MQQATPYSTPMRQSTGCSPALQHGRMAAAIVSDAASNANFDAHATKRRLLTSVRARQNGRSHRQRCSTQRHARRPCDEAPPPHQRESTTEWPQPSSAMQQATPSSTTMRQSTVCSLAWQHGRMAAAIISDAASNANFHAHATKRRLLTSVRARENGCSHRQRCSTQRHTRRPCDEAPPPHQRESTAEWPQPSSAMQPATPYSTPVRRSTACSPA